MRLDQVIVGHLVQVLATVHATGKLCARRMVLHGENTDLYLLGFNDALQAVAGALGLGEALDEAGMVTIEGAATMPSLSIATANTGTQQPLTDREQEIAECVAAGYTTREIAEKLTLEQATIKAHRQNIHGKTGVSDMQGLTVWLRAHPAPEVLPLTPREKEVARMITAGKRNEDIAEALGLSFDTIRSHRANLFKRLRVHSVAELQKYRPSFDDVEARPQQIAEAEGATRHG